MIPWELPKSLTVAGTEYAIRTDFRVILDIFHAMSDPELFEPDADEQEKNAVRFLVLMDILYEDFESIPPEHWSEAYQKAKEFIDCGMDDDGKQRVKTMDWEQDAPIMIPAINRALYCDVRSVDYLHWWSFIGGYMEIGEGLFSTILGIRQKLAKHKKLEKHEQEFYQANRGMIDLKRKYTEEEQRERDEWEEFFKEWGG